MFLYIEFYSDLDEGFQMRKQSLKTAAKSFLFIISVAFVHLLLFFKMTLISHTHQSHWNMLGIFVF